MEYNSFYGGRRGASFVIAATYKSINEMVNNFKKGGAYKTVNYDEYVLITPDNLNDKDNVKLYRRGMDYNNPMGGAEFEGQIVGPSGPAPHTLMTTIADVDAITKQDGLVDDKGNTYRRTEGQYAPTVNLVPGAKGNANARTFDDTTDSIQWAAVSVRDANSYESTVHIGFKFPYPVIDFRTKNVTPYSNGIYTDTSNATRIDDTKHPFYEQWRIDIPKGIKGDAIKNFRVVTASSNIQDYTGKSDDITNNREILVYDYYHYDNKENGEPVSIYLGDYNMIDNINIAEDGTVTVDYSHNDDTVFNKILKWIKNISIDGTTGHVTVLYNHEKDKDGNNTTYETDLRWVKDIVVEDNGTITLKYTTGDDTNSQKKLVKWVTKTEVLTGSNEGEGNQKIKITYNTGDTEEIGNPLNYIINTAIDDRYHLLVYYADPAKRSAAADKATWDGKNDWTDLGYIGNGTGVGAIAGKESDAGVAAVAETMPPYSAWLIVEEE